MVFDLLYVNDRSVMHLSLQQRSLLLRRCVIPKSKRIELLEQKPGKITSDIIDALDDAIMNREEGIMIKNLHSPYVPNERKNKWLKLKPEYIDGLGEDFDLLIIGGYFGEGIGRRGGTISHFLLGVRLSNGEKEHNVLQTNNTIDSDPMYTYIYICIDSSL